MKHKSNYKKPGIWISDILYFYATLYASFSTKNNYQKILILNMNKECFSNVFLSKGD